MLSQNIRPGIKVLVKVGWQADPVVAVVLRHNQRMGSAVAVRVTEGPHSGGETVVQQNCLLQRVLDD